MLPQLPKGGAAAATSKQWQQQQHPGERLVQMPLHTRNKFPPVGILLSAATADVKQPLQLLGSGGGSRGSILLTATVCCYAATASSWQVRPILRARLILLLPFIN